MLVLSLSRKISELSFALSRDMVRRNVAKLLVPRLLQVLWLAGVDGMASYVGVVDLIRVVADPAPYRLGIVAAIRWGGGGGGTGRQIGREHHSQGLSIGAENGAHWLLR